MQLENDQGGQDSAEEIGQGVYDASDEKEHGFVEALVAVCWMGIPGCPEWPE